MRIALEPVNSLEQAQWIRVQRNKPEMYKYFRQDKPITEDEQKRWWLGLRKDRIKLFIVTMPDSADGVPNRIGYVGFNPFNLYAGTAEFGIFILPEYQGKGFGKEALTELLRIGFGVHNLSSIYSDVLDYPGENRFDFYKNMGFEANAPELQDVQYKKQGKWVKAIKFFMTHEMWYKNRRLSHPRGRPPNALRSA